MTRYVVHGRLFSGSLAAPTRNATEHAESDDYGDAVRLAEGMSRRGWSAWVYEDRTPPANPAGFDPTPVPPGGRFRVVGEWRSDGTRVR